MGHRHVKEKGVKGDSKGKESLKNRLGRPYGGQNILIHKGYEHDGVQYYNSCCLS
jgi:hypothetical protein